MLVQEAAARLSDGHSSIFLYGNPTRSTGKFYRVCFGSEQEGWVHKAIDSRDCTLPNKELLAEWIGTYGVDSDFVRVRVRGLRQRPTSSSSSTAAASRKRRSANRRASTTIRSSAAWTSVAVELPGTSRPSAAVVMRDRFRGSASLTA